MGKEVRLYCENSIEMYMIQLNIRNQYNCFSINQLKIMFFVDEVNEIEDSINQH